MRDIKLLIVPDVHGRDFWRKPVMENLDKEMKGIEIDTNALRTVILQFQKEQSSNNWKAHWHSE